MEIFELRYFVGVAQLENIHRAAEKLHVSPASLSKAVRRLEDELGVKLFRRHRRNIRLTEHGRLLQTRALALLQLEQEARAEVAGHPGSFTAVMSGPEILLAKFGTVLAQTLRSKFPSARFEFLPGDEKEALERVHRSEAHLALISGDSTAGLKGKTLAEAKFQTYVGRGHPLHTKAREGRAVAIEEILKHSFASPDSYLLGKVGAKQSYDGWRDDRFPRRIDYQTASLKIIEELVVSGQALAYLPAYYAETLRLQELKITGCPYTCVQKIRVVTRDPIASGWLNAIF